MTPYATAALGISPERVRNARVLLCATIGAVWPLAAPLLLSGKMTHNNDPARWSQDCMDEMIKAVGQADGYLQCVMPEK